MKQLIIENLSNIEGEEVPLTNSEGIVVKVKMTYESDFEYTFRIEGTSKWTPSVLVEIYRLHRYSAYDRDSYKFEMEGAGSVMIPEKNIKDKHNLLVSMSHLMRHKVQMQFKNPI